MADLGCRSAAHRAAAADPIGARVVIEDAFILVDVTGNNLLAELLAAHVRVLDELPEERGIGPAYSRLGLLREDGIAAMRRKCTHHFNVPHQAGVQADQLEFVDACLPPGFLQRSIQFIKIQLIAERRLQRDIAVDALALLSGIRI